MPPCPSAPHSTYRLQITPDFTLHDAAALIPYLAELGVGAVYLSPILASVSGSAHGYDVVDTTQVDPQRGGPEGLAALSGAARAAGLGVIVDIVPNHMGVAVPQENPWWWDVLRLGAASVHAGAFDLDLRPGAEQLVLPLLGAAEDIAAAEIDAAAGLVRFHEHLLPLAPDSAPEGAEREQILAAQHWRLVPWQHERWDLGYRRFFAVKELAGLRIEDETVFEATHTEVRRWFAEGLVDGLRIDHPDGLADPGGYLERLAALTNGAWTVVEKITEPGEDLPADWATAGTTGYEVLRSIDQLLADPASAPVWDRLGEDDPDFEAVALRAKREFTALNFRSEIARLERVLRSALPESHPAVADLEPHDPEHPSALGLALLEIAARFEVYRTYAGGEQRALHHAAEGAAADHGELAERIRALVPVLEEDDEAARRFRQFTGPVMAKGVEDTAFYRYARLTSLNEVGGGPTRLSASPEDFHAEMAHRARRAPEAMTTLTTHDTKRSEDTRARITVLSEAPEVFAALLELARERAPLPRPEGDRDADILLWQAIVGAWPAERERLHAYAVKALRERNLSTVWTAPDADYEAAMARAVDAAFDDPRIAAALAELDGLIAQSARELGIVAKVLQLMAPGIPDVYQGTERWDRSLVDPDNRRPVDFARLSVEQAALQGTPAIDADGLAKHQVLRETLRLRGRHPELLAPASYAGIAQDDKRLVVFARGEDVMVIAARFPLRTREDGWGDVTLHLPDIEIGAWRDVLTGRPLPPGLAVAEILDTYPAALLERNRP